MKYGYWVLCNTFWNWIGAEILLDYNLLILCRDCRFGLSRQNPLKSFNINSGHVISLDFSHCTAGTWHCLFPTDKSWIQLRHEMVVVHPTMLTDIYTAKLFMLTRYLFKNSLISLSSLIFSFSFSFYYWYLSF